MHRLFLSFCLLFAFTSNAQTPNYWQTETYSHDGIQMLNAIESDDHGNTYHLLNIEDSVDLDPSPYFEHWVYPTTGNAECVFFKLDVNRNLTWYKQFHGTQDLHGTNLAYDGKGNIYTVGLFRGTANFNGSTPNGVMNSQGSSDIFICRFDTSGTFDWATSIQSPSQLSPLAAECDASGRIYLTGYFEAQTNFEKGTSNYIFNLSPTEIEEAFIVAYNSDHSLYKVNVMRIGWDVVYDLTCAPNGDVYLCGASYGTTDLDFGSGVDNHTSPSSGVPDFYVMSMDSLWNQKHLYYFNNGANITSIDYVPSSGIIVAGGSFSGTVDFDLSPSNTSSLTSSGSSGNMNGFFMALDTALQFQWVRGIIGTANSSAYVATDSIGMIWAQVSVYGTSDMDPGPGTANITASYNQVVIGRYNSTGQYIWHGATEGGSSYYIDYEVTTNGGFYTAGFYNGTVDFDPMASADSISGRGSASGMLLMLTDCPIFNSLISEDVCTEFTWTNGVTYTESGIYKFNHTTANQCDSSSWLNLNVRNPHDSIFSVGDTMLVAYAPGASIQWLVCGGDVLPDTSFTLSPGFNGSFAAIISHNGCVDTTDCVSLSSIGLNELESTTTNFYPNPASNRVHIIPSEVSGSVTLSIYTMNGTCIIERKENNTLPFDQEVDFPPGVYVLRLEYENQKVELGRLIVE